MGSVRLRIPPALGAVVWLGAAHAELEAVDELQAYGMAGTGGEKS